ncbi:MAG: PepSY domain-containing protein [Phenylobacterium sp.]
MRAVIFAVSISSLALLTSPAAAKDRPPTADERAAVEKVLRAQGYTSWEEIEFDDDRPQRQPVWDIDDARKADGAVFDVKLEPGTLKVLRQTPD